MALGILVWPPLYRIVTMAYMAPMGLYEIGLGLWLAIRGIRIPARAETGKPLRMHESHRL